MRDTFFRMVLLVGACLSFSGAAVAQSAQNASNAGPKTGTLDVTITYDSVGAQSDAGRRFWLMGGSGQVHSEFYKGIGIVGDVWAGHADNISSSNVALSLVTVTFGPRYTYKLPKKKLEVYGQMLIGEAFGFSSVFTGTYGTTDSAYSRALNFGGGANVSVNKRLSFRALEASWVNTNLPNGHGGAQNDLRLGSGFTVHF